MYHVEVAESFIHQMIQPRQRMGTSARESVTRRRERADRARIPAGRGTELAQGCSPPVAADRRGALWRILRPPGALQLTIHAHRVYGKRPIIHGCCVAGHVPTELLA